MSNEQMLDAQCVQFLKRIKKLEADNARLQEALTKAANVFRWHGNRAYAEICESALLSSIPTMEHKS